MLIPNSDVEAELPSLHHLETLVDMWDDLDHRMKFGEALWSRTRCIGWRRSHTPSCVSRRHRAPCFV